MVHLLDETLLYRPAQPNNLSIEHLVIRNQLCPWASVSLDSLKIVVNNGTSQDLNRALGFIVDEVLQYIRFVCMHDSLLGSKMSQTYHMNPFSNPHRRSLFLE